MTYRVREVQSSFFKPSQIGYLIARMPTRDSQHGNVMTSGQVQKLRATCIKYVADQILDESTLILSYVFIKGAIFRLQELLHL
jgi:hypothetical protein